MNQLEFTVTGNRLELSEDVYSTGGSVNFDSCSFDFDEEWDGFERSAVFGIGRDTFRVPLDENNSCFIPSPCMEKEGLITIGVFGTKDDTVIATNAVTHHIDEGVDGLGEWFEEDYSLVLNAVSNMENKVQRCLNNLNDNFDAMTRTVRRYGTFNESEITADTPDGWYKPEAFEGAETLDEITLGESLFNYLDYKFNAMWDDFPNYVHREKIGMDSGEALPVYAYTFEPLNYEKTVLVTACTHGCEDMMFFALASFFDDLCRKSETDRTLSYLKSRVKFIVIPAVSPYSLVSGEAYNENDVDIGLNFPYRWADCTKTSKGSTAGDQTETQNLIDYVEMFESDRLCAAVDFHVSSVSVSGKGIFYPRFKDNCICALADFISRFNAEAESGTESKGILAASVNPTLTNYLADTYGINACEAVWPDELYGGAYDNDNYTKLIEFIGNLLYVMAKNSNAVNRCPAQPFTKYLTWHGGDDDNFEIPVSDDPEVMGISNYSFEMSAPCILSLTGFVVLNVTDACTVKINPVLYQDYSPEQAFLNRIDAPHFVQEIPLTEGVHVIPVSSVLQAYYSSHNSSSRTQYCENVHTALAFSASAASSVQVQAYSLTLNGTPADSGKPVEIISPMGSADDYEEDDVPTQQIIYPAETYVYADSRFSD